MILSMKRAVLPLALLALSGCGGSVETSPDEDSGHDATSDGIAMSDAMDSTNLIPDAGADATHPSDGSDDATLDAGPDAYDGAFFPDGLCGPSTCQHGCCTDVGECVEPPGTAACGWAGSLCQVCDAGPCGDQSGCVVTLFTCGPSNCAGCCIGNNDGTDAAQAACVSGTFSLMCGHGGQACGICGAGEECRAIGFDAGGFCQANNGCDPSNCTGCCINGVCAQGDQAIACGSGGVVCKDCGDAGFCQGGNCACGGPFPPCPDD